MSNSWATAWSVETDNEAGKQTLRWTDADGEHEAPVHPPGSGLVACEARTVTKARQDLICGRVTQHDGSHVSIEHLRRLGAVAE